MIRQTEVFPFGKITKARGLHGEVELQMTEDVFENGDAEYVVLQCDGLLVPFFWEEYRYKNDTTLLIRFEDIENGQAAAHIVGCQAYYPYAHLHETDEDEFPTLQRLCGYRVTNAEGEVIGTIKEVDDSSVNLLLIVTTPQGNEVLLPLHDDLIIDYDNKERVLKMEIPKGLLDL